MSSPPPAARRLLPFLVLGLLVALLLAGVASQYASSDPDGLTKVARDLGFADAEKESAAADSPLADYGTSGVESNRLSGGLAGIAGVAATFLLAGGLLWIVRRRPEPSGSERGTQHDDGSVGEALPGSRGAPSGRSA